MEEFKGSEFSEPAPGITLGCISPEARDLLDTIMEEWGKHYDSFKHNISLANGNTTEPSIYMFAYWLVRWSGLIQPANSQNEK